MTFKIKPIEPKSTEGLGMLSLFKANRIKNMPDISQSETELKQFDTTLIGNRKFEQIYDILKKDGAKFTLPCGSVASTYYQWAKAITDLDDKLFENLKQTVYYTDIAADRAAIL